MSGTTYYERNRDVILNRGNKYYENNKEVLREKRKNKYRELSETDIIICLKKKKQTKRILKTLS